MNHVHDLIDTSEMYLRTVLELEEEGVVPLRARIAERLEQSVPTVSQTVARMERDGLLNVTDERRIELTPLGRSAATRVMRKHRLAECLLVDIIGLDWQLVHDEACRWEHVMSETVELRLLEILGHPTESPYGNPIPGLDELGDVGTRGLPGRAGRADRGSDGDDECRRTPDRRADPVRHQAADPAAPGGLSPEHLGVDRTPERSGADRRPGHERSSSTTRPPRTCSSPPRR